MKELFRARNVAVSIDGRTVLSKLDLHLDRGEILGIYGPYSSSKAAILGLISRSVLPDSGSLFFCGERYDGLTQPNYELPRIFSVSGEETFIGAMSLWENMLTLRPVRSALAPISSAGLKRYISILLREYGLALAPDTALRALSPVVRFMLELIKAKLQRADIALAADFFPEGSREELRALQSLMRRLAGEGMAIVLTSHRYLLLKEYADRIAFLSNGSILKCVPVAEENGALVDRVFSALAGSDDTGPVPPPSGSNVGEPLFTFDLLRTEPLSEPLTLHRGELVEIVRAGRGMVEQLSSSLPKDGDILCIRSPVTGSVIRELTVEENICLRRMNRIAQRGVVKPEPVRVLLRDFAEWYGDERLLCLKNCMNLERHDLIAIALYQMIIQRPKVLLYLDMRRDMDNLSRALMIKAARFLTDRGSAVCFVDTNNGDYGCSADRSYVASSSGRLRPRVNPESRRSSR